MYNLVHDQFGQRPTAMLDFKFWKS